MTLKEDNFCYLSTAYLAPLEYYHCLAKWDQSYIEYYETYSKQSYRNRCSIYTANGILNLSIPVKAPNHTLIKDVKIDNSVPWQKHHFRSILSAYSTSPYFIYYDYQLQPFYESRYNFLLDFNEIVQSKILELIELRADVQTTSLFEKNINNGADFRNTIHPKKNNGFPCPYYNQVFNNKYGFIPNLSIIDLLFNKGPESKEILEYKEEELKKLL